MLIDLYSVMNNEEVLLPYWLRHYERIADRIFVWDDQSTDNTRAMLLAHPKVTILPLEKFGDYDEYWVTEVFPQYEQHSPGVADWVIVADGDEFIYHPDLRGVLEVERFKGTQLIYCLGYTMIAEALPKGNGQIYDEIKNGIPDKLESKWTIHSPDIRMRFKKGRHSGPREGGNSVTNAETGIKLFHYRYLGVEYFEQRDRRNAERLELVVNLGLKYDPKKVRTMPDRSHGVGLDWYAKHKGKAVNVVDDE